MTYVDRVFTKLAERSSRNEATFVVEPERSRYLFWRTIVLFVVGLGVSIGDGFVSEGSLWDTLFSLVTGLFIGASILLGIGRALSYKHGWLKGRYDVMAQLPALLNGHTEPAEWFRAQAFRDLDTLGFTPPEAALFMDEMERRWHEQHGETE